MTGKGYETDDARISIVVWAMAAMAALAAAVALASWIAWRGFSSPLKDSTAPGLPPEPRLEADPRQDLQALRQKEDGLLERYSWVDRSKRIVQIPIERAIDLLAKRGLPARRRKAGP